MKIVVQCYAMCRSGIMRLRSVREITSSNPSAMMTRTISVNPLIFIDDKIVYGN